MRHPQIHRAHSVEHWLIQQRIHPALPNRIPLLQPAKMIDRLKATWGVFTGLYDAVDWER